MASEAQFMATPATLRKERERFAFREFGDMRLPSSDGLALLGTSWHEIAVSNAREALDRHFGERSDVFVATLMALYYKRDGKIHSLVPDVMVATGVPSCGRSSYKVWRERTAPQFVMEVASKSTMDRDCGFKKEQYEELGVREYWQLDQTGLLLKRPLVGHRMRYGRYQPIPPSGEVDGIWQFRSVELGLMLRAGKYRGGRIAVFRDPDTERDVLTGRHMDRALRAAEQGRRAAEGRASAAEEKLMVERQKLEVERQKRLELERLLFGADT